jgi:hypothetical protein
LLPEAVDAPEPPSLPLLEGFSRKLALRARCEVATMLGSISSPSSLSLGRMLNCELWRWGEYRRCCPSRPSSFFSRMFTALSKSGPIKAPIAVIGVRMSQQGN